MSELNTIRSLLRQLDEKEGGAVAGYFNIQIFADGSGGIYKGDISLRDFTDMEDALFELEQMLIHMKSEDY
jgi:hypothetical protein